MLQFVNATPFTGSITLMPDAEGIDALVVVVKATFTLDAAPAVAAEQVPVTVEPLYWGDPASSSLRAAPELLLPKPGTDVLVVGSAWALRGRPVQEQMAAVQVGPVQQVARVTGDRAWRRTTAGYAMTAPEPWLSMPLTWERCFGGREETRNGWHEEPRNPVGVGFRSADGLQPVEGLPVPNVEHAALPMTAWDSRCEPTGFGPVSPAWLPRRQYAGTYDERWERERSPYLPADFDSRFFHVAPPSLIATQPLAGGEPVALHGLHPAGSITLELPRVPLELVAIMQGAAHPIEARLSTVTFEPDAERFTMQWTGVLSCDKRSLRIREVRAGLVTT